MFSCGQTSGQILKFLLLLTSLIQSSSTNIRLFQKITNYCVWPRATNYFKEEFDVSKSIANFVIFSSSNYKKKIINKLVTLTCNERKENLHKSKFDRIKNGCKKLFRKVLRGVWIKVCFFFWQHTQGGFPTQIKNLAWRATRSVKSMFKHK